VRDLPTGSQLKLEVIRSDSWGTKTFTFDLDTEGTRTRDIYAGLTGSDWSDDSAQPIAWKITLLDAQGQPLDDKKSFLWGR